MKEEEVLNYMLKALPEEYSHIGDMIDIIPKEERTVEYLKSKIKMKKGREEKEVKTSTYMAENRGLICYNCQKRGHLARNCGGRGVPGGRAGPTGSRGN